MPRFSPPGPRTSLRSVVRSEVAGGSLSKRPSPGAMRAATWAFVCAGGLSVLRRRVYRRSNLRLIEPQHLLGECHLASRRRFKGCLVSRGELPGARRDGNTI